MRAAIISVISCLLFFAICLYSYLDMQNQLTELRIHIPQLSCELKRVQEENVRLQFAIQQFESPENLLSLARDKAFAHLKFPSLKEVVTVQRAEQFATATSQEKAGKGGSPTLAMRLSHN